jgi:phosphatidylinositol glycan class V
MPRKWHASRSNLTLASVAQRFGIPSYEGLESIVAICIAHTAHLLSVLTLFGLTRAIFPSSSTSGLALTAGLLHILSPAGLFLSAPYAESSCAFLSFLGCLLFTKSRASSGTASFAQDILLVLSGVVFGAATTLRSNAILNGLLLLEEALRTLHALTHDLHVTKLRRLISAGLSGLCVGVGFMLPQYIAYVEYCTASGTQPRQWCDRPLPSIYIFVQDHYWYTLPFPLPLAAVNVSRHNGLFRYWTLSNAPLFLLVAPMLVISVVSSVWAFNYKTSPTSKPSKSKKGPPASQVTEADNVYVLRNLAVSQGLLTLFTLTTGHVQIITRIASSCPVWVWFLAMPSGRGASTTLTKNAVTVMALYGIIQGALFSSFLPPA